MNLSISQLVSKLVTEFKSTESILKNILVKHFLNHRMEFFIAIYYILSNRSRQSTVTCGGAVNEGKLGLL